MCSQPLKVLIVAEDRKHLRRLSKFLNTFGYETQQVADPHHVLFLLKTYAPDFLILDGGLELTTAFSICRTVSGSGEFQGPYTLLMLESPQVRDLSAALQVGVDDFLSKPIDYGEILARLRAGARRREFERRYRAISGIDPLTGMPNRSVFCSSLQSWAETRESGGGTGVCVLLEVDFHAQIDAGKESLIGRDILQEVAAKIMESCGKDDLAASFERGVFAVFLAGVSETEAQAWSERIRYTLNDIEFDFGAERRRVTVSSGMVAFGQTEHPDVEEILKRADNALLVAQRSGYNYVADWQECELEAKAWAELAEPGAIFERTTVKDVMTPCTLVLRSEDSIDRANHAFQQLQTNVLAVVDARGQLQGVLTSDMLGQLDSVEHHCVRDLMTHDVKRFEETESFERLKDFFGKDSRQLAIAVRQGRPTGWMTSNNLLALGTFLNAESFRSGKDNFSGSRDLQVVDLCTAD
jgi:two-component system cell cycle response regulator